MQKYQINQNQSLELNQQEQKQQQENLIKDIIDSNPTKNNIKFILRKAQEPPEQKKSCFCCCASKKKHKYNFSDDLKIYINILEDKQAIIIQYLKDKFTKYNTNTNKLILLLNYAIYRYFKSVKLQIQNTYYELDDLYFTIVDGTIRIALPDENINTDDCRTDKDSLKNLQIADFIGSIGEKIAPLDKDGTKENKKEEFILRIGSDNDNVDDSEIIKHIEEQITFLKAQNKQAE
ncbi:MAG: hypothetical protein N4A49_11025 [Marinifilaceae bacterium]|jgi:hypothetical protein|nr:hypothetical protein [Marinifilaceae bacterium]